MPSDACVDRSQSALRVHSERNQAQSGAIKLTARRFSASSSAVRAFTCKGEGRRGEHLHARLLDRERARSPRRVEPSVASRPSAACLMREVIREAIREAIKGSLLLDRLQLAFDDIDLATREVIREAIREAIKGACL